MTTDLVNATSCDCWRPEAPAHRAGVGPDRAARRLARLLRTVLVAGLILVGIVFSVWWYCRAQRLLADLRTIETWIGNQEYGLAGIELHEHLKRAPHNGAARMMLARVLAAGGDLVGCTHELRQVPTGWPQKAEALFREGQAHLLMNRAREAEAAFRDSISADLPHQADPAVFHDASRGLLALYATENRWDDARTVLWKIYDRATPAYRPTVLAMRLQYELERIAPAESVKSLSRYVAADPTDWEAKRALANAELALGQRSLALRDMRDCLNARPEDPRVWRDYLTMLHSLGEMEAFHAALDAAPAVAETEPDLWIFRGETREHARDWATAATHLRRALELNPKLSGVHYRLTIVESRLGHTALAAAHRKHWQELLEARGELRQAFAAYFDAQQRLANDSPELLASLERLASICQTLGWSRSAEGWGRLALP